MGDLLLGFWVVEVLFLPCCLQRKRKVGYWGQWNCSFSLGMSCYTWMVQHKTSKLPFPVALDHLFLIAVGGN